jgi:DNA-binding transcriptional ArsR family regulator
MAVRARKVHVIKTVEELKALRSPTRLRLLTLLRRHGEASVSILADRIGIKLESLYYHVHVLQKAGLIVAARERVTGRRPETIYAPVAPHFRIDDKNRDPDFLRALLAMYQSQIRHAERGLDTALQSEIEASGPRTSTYVRQYEVTMRSFKADRLRRLIGTIDDFMVDSDDPKGIENYTLTITLSRNDPLKEA